MAKPAPIRFALEIDPGSEPIAGRLRHEDGRSWTFTGWVELTRVLDEARAGDPRPPGTQPGCGERAV